MILSIDQLLDNNDLKIINYILQNEISGFYLPNYSKYEYNFYSKEINAFCPSRIGVQLSDGNILFFSTIHLLSKIEIGIPMLSILDNIEFRKEDYVFFPFQFKPKIVNTFCLTINNFKFEYVDLPNLFTEGFLPDEKLFLLNQRNENLIIFYNTEEVSIGIASTNYNNSSVKLLLDGKAIKKFIDSFQINSSDSNYIYHRTLNN